MKTVTTFCAYCTALCGLVLDVEDGRVTSVRGDPDHPLSRGFTCAKGRHIADFVTAPGRLRCSLVRGDDGVLHPATAAEAVAAVAPRLAAIRDAHGPDAVAVYWGTAAVMAPLLRPVTRAFWSALGSAKWFSTMTIDQAPKWVAPGRIGQWLGGRQRFCDSDVWMFVGVNPVVSMLGGTVTGFPQQDALRRLRDASRRGLRSIVVDPRRSETAAAAELHLQLVPGTDAVLLAAMLRIVLAEGLWDRGFCAAHVEGIDELRRAVDAVTPQAAADRCGLDAGDIEAAARLFGRGRRGMVSTGTGANMGPEANLVEHLAWCLNIVCGRFAREGDPWALPTVLSPAPDPVAEATPPDRSWERGYRSRLGYGHLFGELPTATLPDEVLAEGTDRVRALLVLGGNPAVAIPGQRRTVDAFRRLELLVVIDPFLTETARLAHAVLSPALQLERPQTTAHLEHHVGAPFAQYAPPVLAPPEGIREDWEYVALLGRALGLTMEVFGRILPADGPLPDSETMLRWQAEGGRVPLDDVRRHPHGRLYDDLPALAVGPGRPDAGRLVLLAPDVAEELRRALAPHAPPRRPYLMTVRRARETLNSMGRQLPGLSTRPYNRCFLHPDDAGSLGVAPDDLVELESDHGWTRAVVACDPTLRRGVASMTHGFGGLPGEDDDPRRDGTNPNRLLAGDRDLQAIDAMPHMTGVPVTIVPVAT